MKELLQQTMGIELNHCQKLSGKTKHIQKSNKKETRASSINPWQPLILRKKRHFSSKNDTRVKYVGHNSKGGHHFLSFYYFTP